MVAEHFEQPGTSSTASGSTAGSINEGASTSTNQCEHLSSAATIKYLCGHYKIGQWL